MESFLEFLQSVSLRDVTAAGVGAFMGLLLARALRARRKGPAGSVGGAYRDGNGAHGFFRSLMT